MISIFAAATLAAASAPCPEVVTPDAFICRAVQASANEKPDEAAQAFEQAAQAVDASTPQAARLYAAAGNSWIAAGQPGKAALDLDKALTGTGLQAEQRGEALLDRARPAEAQNDLKTARAKVNEAQQTISNDPFLWYFSAALATEHIKRTSTVQLTIRLIDFMVGSLKVGSRKRSHAEAQRTRRGRTLIFANHFEFN